MDRDDNQNMFGTTRGKLLLLLCRGPRTVNELAGQLGITDNAVRAQLVNLQEGELVRPVGLRPGVRKPHVDYELTPKARQSFPRAYEPVLAALLEVLRERLAPEQTRALMKEVALRLFATWVGELRERGSQRRADELLRKLDGVVTGVFLKEERDHFQLQACGCPLASVTASHPEVCDLLSEILSDVLGTPVRDRCDRSESPRCCFEVAKTPAR